MAMTTPYQAYAYHLHAQGSGLSGYVLRFPHRTLSDMETIRESIGMDCLRDSRGHPVPPIAIYAQGEGKAWGSGNTIILPLSDSHMSLHASEELGIVFLDLFSCRDFDANKVLSFIERRWGGRWTAKLYDRSEEDQLMWTYPILSRL